MSTSTSASLREIAQKILEDALQNITHEILIHQHRAHKMLLASLDPTTRLPHCSTCKLPRLLDPPLAPGVRGATAEPPATTNYCDRKPWARRPGHDIYGNPFLKSDVTGRPLTKKEREAQSKAAANGTPASEEGTGPPSPDADGGIGSVAKGEKKASKIDEKLRKGEYVPWHTCPSCKRSLLITRFAKHLEQCMGLSGRKAGREAAAKIGGSQQGSRGATPNLEVEEDGEEGEGKGGGVRKKLLKKGLKEKVKKGGGVLKSLGVKGAVGGSSPVRGADGKREREDGEEGEEEEAGHFKKRQKLQRVGSTTSIVSQSTAAPEMERSESQDGSLLDASFAED
ncbi:uncharacterized protein RCC_04364 [Ramularia collo-cygni]|uniref:SAGA-associated factor 11 n=1 Tax=Ramularia collo-cygni TaxID=112498 RepID=A0A2D3VAF9_9PEZI|nr:uncharacterized protein RCC_04364 [Ramularia collo-cygni]CZT18519.1 uncharacterized protein RCC_04364 [Ramularia collo-cygni]